MVGTPLRTLLSIHDDTNLEPMSRGTVFKLLASTHTHTLVDSVQKLEMVDGLQKST